MNMLKTFSASIAFAALTLTGCGGGDGGGNQGPPPKFTATIQSDPAFDGYIEQTSATPYPVTQGMSSTVQSVLAGIDPVSGNEFRAFLDFPLTGAGGIPGNAVIDSAFLDIYVNSINPISGTLPIRIELVSFQPPNLLDTDFDVSLQPALAAITVSPDFIQADVNTNVSIDITSLMVEAQRLNLLDFQIRIMEDLGSPIFTLLEINDTTGPNRSTLAPLLTVTYF